ncbi:aminoglycoside 6-adenylyltransferase [Lacibacter sp. H375]|uniref:aminoglycoside 6-adenylyltransferase n=1 Tax=Lacibacter sp. H375 TaxID=3133424 RepID=UPI0030BA7198
MLQQAFAAHAAIIAEDDPSIEGLAVAGSWLTQELDEFSDLDLILITTEKVDSDKAKMMAYASKFGNLLNGFTGEHVGEPRLLICLYNNPLLHVDIKFITAEELKTRVENPVLLFDRTESLQQIIDSTSYQFPHPDHQWVEDRFWTWVHYALLKIGRGEYMEAHDFLAFLRMVVFGPLLHIKNNNLPRGVRKVETTIAAEDFKQLQQTLAVNNKESLLAALDQSVQLYRSLRNKLFTADTILQQQTEEAVMKYFEEMK